MLHSLITIINCKYMVSLFLNQYLKYGIFIVKKNEYIFLQKLDYQKISYIIKENK